MNINTVIIRTALSAMLLLSILSVNAKQDAEQRELIIAHGATMIPDESLKEWVSFADVVAVVTIINETQHAIDATTKKNGEGLVGRTVHARIDEIAWAPEDGTSVREGDVLDVSVFGWSLKHGKLIPITGSNSPRIEVDGTYIMPLAQFERGWGPITPQSVIPVNDSSIARKDADRIRAKSPVAKRVKGKSIAKLRKMLNKERVDEVAARNRHLRPNDRAKMVMKARRLRHQTQSNDRNK